MITSSIVTLFALVAHPMFGSPLHAPMNDRTFDASAQSEAPFQDLSFDQALAAAKKEQKIVMIDFFTTWCVPCRKLDKITWKDADVQAWIAKTAIAVKLDAEKETELAKRFTIDSYPTIVFVKSDGKEIDRLLGFKEPAEFVRDATSALAGKDAVERVKEKMAGRDDGPMARQGIGDALAQQGKYAEALTEYLWCFDHGAEVSAAYTGVRLSFLLSSIASLGRKHPPAIKALESRRDAAESALFSDKGKDSNAAELFALNDALRATERNIAAWERLKKEGKYDGNTRSVVWIHIVKPLVEAQRYADAVEAGGDLAAKAKWEIQMASFRPTPRPSDAKVDEGMAAITNGFTVSSVARYYEAAVGAGQSKVADSIADQLIAFSPAYQTYIELIERADRAGALDAARAMATRGLAAVPEKERRILQDALERIPDRK